jgi:SAM-dependent methyltransferase
MTTNPWARLLVEKSQNKYDYPSAPSPEEVFIFEQWSQPILRNASTARVVVLGATPSLRDLSLHAGKETIAADWSFDAIETLGSFLTAPNRSQEIFVKANWLELPIADHSIHLVLADLSFNNLRSQDYVKLFQELSRLLVPGGYFLTRQLVRLPKIEYRSFQEQSERLRNNEIHLRDWKYETVFWNSEGNAWLRESTKTFYWERYFAALKRAYERGYVGRRDFEWMWSQRHGVMTTLLKKSEWDRMFRKFFRVVESDWCRAYESSQDKPFYLGKVI